jgi:hypothetical protein
MRELLKCTGLSPPQTLPITGLSFINNTTQFYLKKQFSSKICNNQQNYDEWLCISVPLAEFVTHIYPKLSFKQQADGAVLNSQ